MHRRISLGAVRKKTTTTQRALFRPCQEWRCQAGSPTYQLFRRSRHHPEAVYLHHGESYLVRELDLDGKVAYVERRETDYYTQAVLESSSSVLVISSVPGYSAAPVVTAMV